MMQNLCQQEDILFEDFEPKKKEMLEKIADTLFDQEYRYLDYFNHLIMDCEDSKVVEGGCPIDRCKSKEPMSFKDLRTHLREQCNKITMECSCCKEKMKRPYAPYHDCYAVYEERLKETGVKLSTVETKMGEQNNIIAIMKQQIKEKNNKLDETATTEQQLLTEIEELRRLQAEVDTHKIINDMPSNPPTNKHQQIKSI